MSKFKLILTIAFVIFMIGGLIAFATFKSNNNVQKLPTVTIWGTFPQGNFNDFVGKINLTLPSPLSVNYVEIPAKNFRKTFIEELAKGRGPDMILVSQQEILGYSDKIIEIPNTVLTQRDFQNTFVDQASLYLTPTGALALPFVMDPMIMYWNRTMLTNAGFARYPVYWDEYTEMIKRINIKDENSNVRRTSIALGEFKNIDHARAILSTILLQSGNPITVATTYGVASALGDISYQGSKTSIPAVSFFTQFANPRDSYYSWNRSLPSSKSSFLSGNLATYFGLTSELLELRQKNPNIDYDVAPMPQIRTGKIRTAYGNMHGISIVRSTANQSASYAVMQSLTASSASTLLGQITYLPSVRRDIISGGSVDPYMSIFLDAALISRGWLDMNPTISNQIFTDMVELVTSGRSDIKDAISQASDELDVSLSTQ